MSDTHTVEDIKKHVRIYMGVFGALAVLTVVTVGIGYLELPMVPALLLGLAVALIKGGLVAAYFMHLLEEKKVILYSLALTVVFFLCMVAIFMATFYDQVSI